LNKHRWCLSAGERKRRRRKEKVGRRKRKEIDAREEKPTIEHTSTM
jgi:hypothetical protein